MALGATAQHNKEVIDLRKLRDAFAELSSTRARLFSAPGRVNLIGEHTDYNEGFVLPIGASLRVYVAAALRHDGQVRVFSQDLNETKTFSVAKSSNSAQRSKGWLSYVEGITQTLVGAGVEFPGADFAIVSEVPLGGGLSSSAALEVSIGFAILKLCGSSIDLLDLAIKAQEAEHVFVGTRSGLMDQLSVTFAEKDRAMLIDCRSLEIRQIPINLPTTAVVICNTGVKHNLANSAYNERRQECEHAVALLREKKPEVRALRDVNFNEIDLLEDLPQPERSRARHVIAENERTIEASRALAAGDVNKLGTLMIQSHVSLRDDFEVSCRELDIMFELAQEQRGVSGARMMGGGFGGCTVNLVELDHLDDFTNRISYEYRHATGRVPVISVVHAEAGVRELS